MAQNGCYASLVHRQTRGLLAAWDRMDSRQKAVSTV